MSDTHELIERLAAGAGAVRVAGGPWRRAALWLLVAAAVVGLLAAAHGLRPDLRARLAEPTFCAGLAAAVLTGVLAALAAVLTAMPDRSRRWLLLPLPAAAVWIGSIGAGCLAHWVAFDAQAVRETELAGCACTAALAGVPLSLAMGWLLRDAARLRPALPILAGALAVAALTAATMLVLHPFAASLMLLIWTIGVAALVMAGAAALGLRVLRAQPVRQ